MWRANGKLSETAALRQDRETKTERIEIEKGENMESSRTRGNYEISQV